MKEGKPITPKPIEPLITPEERAHLLKAARELGKQLAENEAGREGPQEGPFAKKTENDTPPENGE